MNEMSTKTDEKEWLRRKFEILKFPISSGDFANPERLSDESSV